MDGVCIRGVSSLNAINYILPSFRNEGLPHALIAKTHLATLPAGQLVTTELHDVAQELVGVPPSEESNLVYNCP